MKKLIAIAALGVMTLGYSVTVRASATDIFAPDGNYYGIFAGTEFALQDGKQIENPSRIVDDSGNLQAGFSMVGLLYAATISQTPTAGSAKGQGADLLEPDGGAVIAVLRGFEADRASGNIYTDGMGVVNFTGGYIDMYYVSADVLGTLTHADAQDSFASPSYDSALGSFVYQDGTAMDFSQFGLLGTFQLAETVGEFTGIAKVDGINGDMHAQIVLYGDLIEPGILGTNFDNNLYGLLGNDVKINAALEWSQETGSFQASSFDVQAGAYLSTASNTAVPEPTTLLLFGAGLMGLAAFGRRRLAA